MKALHAIGGEAGLRELVSQFYDLMETLPEASNLRRLHARGHGLDHARSELFLFLSGFMGGRRLYAEKHGHMDLKLIHAHVPVRQADADTWVLCMQRALDEEGHQGPEIVALRAIFQRVANMLINEIPDWEEQRFDHPIGAGKFSRATRKMSDDPCQGEMNSKRQSPEHGS